MAKKYIRVPVEVDITYVNKTWFSLKYKKDVKHYIIGLFQRGVANVNPITIIKAIPDNEIETIVDAVLTNAREGCILYSEAGILPEQLKTLYEVHEMKNERVTGDIHINNVRNMWKDLKRVIKDCHVQVSQKHLQSYCNEVSWRINHRHLSPSDKFHLLIQNSVTIGKRTYKDIVK